MGKILFLNEESRKIFLSRKKGKNKKNDLDEPDYFLKALILMEDLSSGGCSYEEVKDQIDERIFTILYWMKLYDNPRDQRDKRRAFLELKRIMLNNDLLFD